MKKMEIYQTLVRGGGRYPPFGQKPNYFRFFHMKISLMSNFDGVVFDGLLVTAVMYNVLKYHKKTKISPIKVQSDKKYWICMSHSKKRLQNYQIVILSKL